MEDGCIQETIAAIDKAAGMQHKCTPFGLLLKFWFVFKPRFEKKHTEGMSGKRPAKFALTVFSQ